MPIMNGMISIASGSQVFTRNEEKTIINQTIGLPITHLINILYSVWPKNSPCVYLSKIALEIK